MANVGSNTQGLNIFHYSYIGLPTPKVVITSTKRMTDGVVDDKNGLGGEKRVF